MGVNGYNANNIKWRNVQKTNVVNNVELWKVKFKGNITKWPVQKLIHRTTPKQVQHHDATDI